MRFRGGPAGVRGQNFGGFSQVGRPLLPPCRGAAAGDRTPAGASRSVKQAGTFMQRRVGQRDSLRQGVGSMPGSWAVVCLPPFFFVAGLQHASTAGPGEKCVGYLTWCSITRARHRIWSREPGKTFILVVPKVRLETPSRPILLVSQSTCSKRCAHYGFRAQIPTRTSTPLSPVLMREPARSPRALWRPCGLR